MSGTTPSVYIPPGLSKVHPGLEQALKSIATAVAALHESVQAAATPTVSRTTSTATSSTQSGTTAQISPIIETFGFSGALTPPCAVFELSNGVVEATDVTIPTESLPIGICTSTNSAQALVTTFGDVTFAGWSWTPGEIVYLGVAGALTQAPSASHPQVAIGWAVSATRIRVEIQQPLGTIATQNANAVDITGGSIDGTTVGHTTPGTGAFTTLTVNSGGATTPVQVTANGASIDIEITDTGANGATIKLVGNGGTTPSKSIRVSAGLIQILDDAGAAIITIDDGGDLAIAGGFVFTSPYICDNTGTFANGAGAQAATLTNGPTAGNPTKWIPLVDNGVTRYVPAW